MTTNFEPGTYYLQQIDGRLMIDDHLHDGAIKIAECYAKDWQDARAQFDPLIIR